MTQNGVCARGFKRKELEGEEMYQRNDGFIQLSPSFPCEVVIVDIYIYLFIKTTVLYSYCLKNQQEL